MGEFDEGRGYIKLYRKLDTWGWYTDLNTLALFIHILLHVNHKAREINGVKVPAGAMITSSTKLAEQMKMSRQQVRTALNHLKTSGELTVKSTNKYMLVKVVKWKEYQGEATNKKTGNQPTANQLPTTNKNDKNDKYNISTRARARGAGESVYDQLMN